MSNQVGTVVKLLRSRHWVKNLFVFVPLVFSGRLLEPGLLLRTIIAFAALCVISSSMYIVNDLLDIRRDREHPKKRLRPLPAGEIQPMAAAALSVVLLVLGVGLIVYSHFPPMSLGLTGGYILLVMVYSLFLKMKVIVDVLTIAVGFVLRVLIGASAVGVMPSHWLILCTFLLATFLGFSKRRHELVALREGSDRHRPVLSLYSEQFLDSVSLLTLAMTLTCYTLYTIAPETVLRFGTTALVYTTLIVMFALFRYLFLIHVRKLGSPVEILYFDRQIVLAVAVWVLYIVIVVYTMPSLRTG